MCHFFLVTIYATHHLGEVISIESKCLSVVARLIYIYEYDMLFHTEASIGVLRQDFCERYYVRL